MSGQTSLVELRHELHRNAETAFQENRTAAIVKDRLQAMGVQIVADDVGGLGILAKLGDSGKRILLRADLDALPMREASNVLHQSETGAHHACGHDGHMTMLLGALEVMAKNPPCEVWALFQPAEETGEGMLACLEHPDFPDHFDHALAIHNVPEHPLGTVLLRRGPAAVASTGLRIALQGETSHAAEPQNGRNPIPAVARLVPHVLNAPTNGDEHAVAAIVHIGGGGPRFGTSSGDALVAATLRAGTDVALEAMLAPVIAEATREANEDAFDLAVERIEPFPATVNDDATVDALLAALTRNGIPTHDPGPFPWSEDFGHATNRWPGALIGLGSGEKQPALHRPNYDFPDSLIGPGVNVWVTMVEALA